MSDAGCRFFRSGLGALLLACAGLNVAPSALAHASFQGAYPEPDARLAESPAEIRIRFNEPVTPVAVRLLDAALEPVAGTGSPESAGHEVRLPLARALPDGWYLVSYRVISADAHPVAASFRFAVGDAEEAPQGVAPASEPGGSTVVASLLRPLLLISLVLAAGLALFRLTLGGLAGERLRAAVVRAGRGTSWTTAGLAIAAFAIGGAEMSGEGAAGLLAASTWRVAAGSTLGASTLLAVAGALLAAIGQRERGDGPVPAILLAAGALALAASRAVTGHAAGSSAAIMLATGLHVLAASFWAGALWPLWLGLRRQEAAGAYALLVAFSRIAVVSVSLLILAGLVMAWSHLGSLGALAGSSYGLLLLGKLAVVVTLLALAATNKLWLTPALADRHGPAAGRLRLSVGTEIALMVAVLLVSVTLARTPPPSATPAGSAIATAAVEGTLLEGDYRVGWQLTPAVARQGGHELAVRLQNRDGTPLDALAVEVGLALPGRGIEPLKVPLARRGTGEFAATVPGLTAAGEWGLVLEILVTDFDRLTLETTVRLH